MAFPAKKKPDFSLILGMGPKRPPQSGPPDFGGKSDPEPDPGDPNESAEGETSGAIKPEAVCYRTADQTCGSCEYMQDDGQCSRLMMPVADGDGCNLHEPKAGGTEMAGSDQMPDMGGE